MRLGIIAWAVSESGGMDRAAAEVVRRFAHTHDVLVIATACEITAPRLTWVPVPARRGPAVFRSWALDRAVRRVRLGPEPIVTNSVGTISAGVQIITAHFCQRAFLAQCGGLRGQGRLSWTAYHLCTDRIHAERERRAYESPMLRAVIAVSQGIKRELMEHFGLPSDRIVVIPNGVDQAVFKPVPGTDAKRRLREALGLPVSPCIGLFVGGDWERKGLSDAIRAVAGLEDVLLVVVGAGDTARFQAIARSAGSAGQVVFVGLTSRPEQYFAAADVFVFPSRYESFGLAALEAAASGLPVLAPHLNGIEEWLEDGVNGYVVDHDPDALRERLQCLRDDRRQLDAMSAAAVRSTRRYTWDAVAAQQLAVFESVAATLPG